MFFKSVLSRYVFTTEVFYAVFLFVMLRVMSLVDLEAMKSIYE